MLQIALIAIDLAVQDQLDRADVDPDKALKASGSTVGPWIKNFVDTTVAARSEARRVGNDANKLKSALEDSGVRDKASPKQVEEAKKLAEQLKEFADKADAILLQMWSLTRLPSECYNGFAGGVQQSGQPVRDGS